MSTIHEIYLAAQAQPTGGQSMVPGQIITRTGKLFYPLEPRPEDVDPRDIAHALAHKCRYTGHTEPFYSVAQHSLLVSHILGTMKVSPEVRLQGLLHDAAEAYLPDVASPIKDRVFIDTGDAQDWNGSPEYRSFREIESRILLAIAQALNLEWPQDGELPAIIKGADLMALGSERRYLMPDPPDGPEPEITVQPWPGPPDMGQPRDPASVALRFMHRLETLQREIAWRDGLEEPHTGGIVDDPQDFIQQRTQQWRTLSGNLIEKPEDSTPEILCELLPPGQDAA